jgi:anthranilate phosphoribosyltransferase
VLQRLTEQLTQSSALTDGQVEEALAALVDERISPEAKADFLTALARKSETPAEIAAFARALRDRAVPVPVDAATRARDLLDVCGTGGDHLGTFNISTAVAILAAAAGVTVAKHGNRAVTSQAGSADVLEALGIRIDLPPEDAARWLREHQFAFLFAPHYHPAFKHIAPARKLCAARGQRTLFNFLGPLLNPARPTVQLIGVPRAEWCEPIGRVLQSLGLRRAMVVSGRVDHGGPGRPAFLDEVSPLGPTCVAEFYQDRAFSLATLQPDQFPMQPVTLADLRGGDRAANAEIVRRILRGEERGPKRDAVLLNAGAALFVALRAKSIQEGWAQAAALIDSGATARKLDELIAASKR